MIIITPHAVDRYHERICPTDSRANAEHRLRTMSQRAKRLKGNTVHGSLRYLLDDATLIVKDSPGEGLVAMTVYPLPVRKGEIPAAEWAMALERVTGEIHREAGPAKVTPAPLDIPEDKRCENALAQAEAALDRVPAIRAKYMRIADEQRAERDAMRAALVAVAKVIPDTPEVRAALGVYAYFLNRETP